MKDKKIIVKNSKNGAGVFANKNLEKGEVILEFHGELFTREELPKPYNEVEDHYLQIDNDLYMGPSGEADDFFNHSCDPNAGLSFAGKKIFLVAIENIADGDEITWDYSTTMNEDDWEMECKCGSKSCRGRIRDFKYLPEKIQKKYLDLKIVPKYITEN